MFKILAFNIAIISSSLNFTKKSGLVRISKPLKLFNCNYLSSIGKYKSSIEIPDFINLPGDTI